MDLVVGRYRRGGNRYRQISHKAHRAIVHEQNPSTPGTYSTAKTYSHNNSLVYGIVTVETLKPLIGSDQDTLKRLERL